jgi:hypothetical protein
VIIVDDPAAVRFAARFERMAAPQVWASESPQRGVTFLHRPGKYATPLSAWANAHGGGERMALAPAGQRGIQVMM